jgi:acyl-coenzyme A synthetase/AMP-(fatty) acid ligase
VRKEIGPIATPDVIQFAPGLPKTRSGKIMRRILRKIAEAILKKLDVQNRTQAVLAAKALGMSIVHN